MTFPKLSASWSVSLISCFQNSDWNKAAHNAFLQEPDLAWNGSGATAEGFLSECRLASHITDAMEFTNTPRKEKEMSMFLFSPGMGPGPRSMAFACWTPGLRAILRLREEQNWTVPSSTLFWKGTATERQPSDLTDVLFSNCQCIDKKGAAQEIARWKFSIQPSLTTFLPTVNFLVKTENFVKKLRLFFLQALCFSWNDWMPKRSNF